MKDKKILNNETMKELTNETDEEYNKRLTEEEIIEVNGNKEWL